MQKGAKKESEGGQRWKIQRREKDTKRNIMIEGSKGSMKILPLQKDLVHRSGRKTTQNLAINTFPLVLFFTHQKRKIKCHLILTAITMDYPVQWK